LTRAGYDTVQDLSTSSAEQLSKQLDIPLSESQALFASILTTSVTLTQSAASLSANTHRFSSHCTPIDKLLNGGLTKGHILEVSGPPGTLKEAVGVGFVRSFVERQEDVLFVDTQNMTGPQILIRALDGSPELPSNYKSFIYHINIHTLCDFMMFIHNLPAYLDTHPNTHLLVLNSISFPFQTPNLNPNTRAALLDQVRQALTKACATRGLTVVTTSQLATKLLNPDGSPGNFETGSTAVMVPQLGPGYLPSGRAHRIIIHPESRTSGHVRLLSSPIYQPGKGSAPREAYIVEGGCMK